MPGCGSHSFLRKPGHTNFSTYFSYPHFLQENIGPHLLPSTSLPFHNYSIFRRYISGATIYDPRVNKRGKLHKSLSWYFSCIKSSTKEISHAKRQCTCDGDRCIPRRGHVCYGSVSRGKRRPGISARFAVVINCRQVSQGVRYTSVKTLR